MTEFTNKKILIFDCDGVLFHSEEANLAYFEICLKKTAGIPLKGELRRKATYMSVLQLFQEIYDTPRKAENAYRKSQEIPYDPYLPLITPTFDFEEHLPCLKKEKFLAIATNRSKSMNKLTRHFNLSRYFHYTISAREAPPKPAPDMLLSCCDYFNSSPASALFIGDSDSDAEAAKNAGISYIHIGEHDTYRSFDTTENLILNLLK